MTFETTEILQPSERPSKLEQEGKIVLGDVEEQAEKNTNVKSGQDRSNIYGSFLIDDSEFAILVSSVKEVVNEPGGVTTVPLSPSFMLGLFNLRGMIIPIVDLRTLLEFPAMDGDKPRKVAIIEFNGQCIGLLFDKTGEILNERNAAKVAFRPPNGRAKDVVVDGVLKFNNGERLVQILDPVELLNLEKLPLADNGLDKNIVHTAKGERRNCISFQSGRTSCAIDLRYVKEVKELTALDQSLMTHDDIIGTINLRGTILPIVDFRGFMGDDAVFKLGQTLPKERKLLVIETLDGPVGLMVFSVDSILTYYSEDLLPFVRLALPRSEFVKGCVIDDDDNIVLLLDHEKLMEEPSLVSAAKACQEIFPPEASLNAKSTQDTRRARLTYIQFTFGKKFAFDTSLVSEVINMPEDILEPPYALKFVEGIINLRGELITLFNPRTLYGMPAGPEEGQKVLIFKHDDQKYGMVVDSVDEIITTLESSISELDVGAHRGMGRNVNEDVVGCLYHTLPDGNDVSILILNAEAMVDRCLRASE